MQRQDATEKSSLQALSKKILDLKYVADKANLLKDRVGQFDYCQESPEEWLKKFESAIRICCQEEEMDDDFYFAYLQYFLTKNQSNWFYDVCERKKLTSWFEFKEEFKNHFWKCYWKCTDLALTSEPGDEDSLLEYSQRKKYLREKNFLQKISDFSFGKLEIFEAVDRIFVSTLKKAELK